MGKNIVICCDGTDNQIEEDNTNVVRIFRCIPNGTTENDTEQRTYYDPGVGTFSAKRFSPTNKIGKLLGSAFGWGVQKNINDAYRYLMDTYEEGDYVYLFGFSRGAFTVRALSGMLNKCGLLTSGSYNLIPYAAKIYGEHDNNETASFFKEHYARHCTPHMIGVFDTVSSLGLFYSRLRFFDQSLAPDIPYAYHAVSIDEQRPKFPVSLWDERTAAPDQTIEQVWFGGVHSDVGGGYSRKGLSDIPLNWMLQKCSQAGLTIDASGLTTHSDPHAGAHESLTWPWRVLGLATGHWPTGANPRRVPPDSLIHESVEQRKGANLGYTPNLPESYRFVS